MSSVGRLAAAITKAYRAPTASLGMSVWESQATVLGELYEKGGALGNIGVGGGKTLITFLAPSIVKATRPVLVVPAKLVKKTWRDFAALAHEWLAPISPSGSRSIYTIRVVSYEKVSRPGGDEVLGDCDLLMCDEAHKLKHTKSSCTRKILRFCQQHPQVPCMFLSGTFVSRSLHDFWHILCYTHTDRTMPLPSVKHELEAWAGAVDEKVDTRYAAGALSLLDASSGGQIKHVDFQQARKIVGDRIFSTPGCIRTTSPSCDSSIRVTLHDPKPHQAVQSTLAKICIERVDPNGDELLPADIYRYTRQLALGFYYKWDPQAPIRWLEARKRWKGYARAILELERPGLDSELDIANGIDQGRLQDHGALAAWRDIRDTFTPNPVPVWLTEEPLEDVVKLAKKIGPCIVWVAHRAVGDKISEITGWPYFREKGLDRSGRFIDDAPASAPIIASIESNKEGRNLQKWSKNLVLTPMSDGLSWEQLIGRTHRAKQTADCVEVHVRLGHHEVARHFTQAVKDASLQQTISGQAHRLLLADYENMDVLSPEMQNAILNTNNNTNNNPNNNTNRRGETP